ncbi:MAG TPA: hypothetical protein PKB10_04265 [Tepidisphaeraceae bacterium]|nr:hypothetical protein [Tepidisphaeraceae bacterium]
MAEGARVESIESLTRFRIALIKFAEACDLALAGAEAELGRTSTWLETEQLSYWQTQIRKRREAVERAKEAVRMKKLYKDSTGRQQSAVEEEKMLKVAQRRVEEAETKLAATRRYIRVMQRETQMYKGGVQRLATSIADAVPNAASVLANHVETLQRYVGLGPATVGSGASSTTPTSPAGSIDSIAGSMARPMDETAVQPTEQTPSSDVEADGDVSEAPESKER